MQLVAMLIDHCQIIMKIKPISMTDSMHTKPNIAKAATLQASEQLYDVIIIGAGVVGMVAAIALVQRGYQVLLLDNKPLPDEATLQQRLRVRDARVYAMNRASIALLETLGAWQFIKRKADFDKMQVWGRDDFGELIFCDDDKQGRCQPLGSMVEPSVLDEALWQCAKLADGLDLAFAATLLGDGMAIDERRDRVIVRYQQHGTHKVAQAKLLLGADGRHSLVRQAMAVGVVTLDYHQKAICCAIYTDKPHDNTARQVMLPTGTLAMLPMAHLPTDDKTNRWHSVVWSLPTALADAYLAEYQRDESLLKNRLALASGYELGMVAKLESLASFPLSAQAAKRYYKGRLALLGDAAHGVHPLAGQGLNLGLSDVAQFLALMDKYHHKSPLHPQLLHDYQRATKSHNELMMHSFSLIHFAYASGLADVAMLRYLRSECSHQIAKIPFVIRQFIKRANR